MKIAIAQINCLVGDLEGNAARIFDYAERAKQAGASLLLTPELSLTGYPPEDLLLREGFIHASAEALVDLAARVSGITVIVGHPHRIADKRYNAASVLQNGKIVATYLKHCLPNHTVFDEVRYFASGTEPCVFDLDGVKFGLNICADIWEEGVCGAPNPAAQARAAGAQVLLVLNASPFHMGKQDSRYQLVASRTRENDMAVVYANMAGGQDELVFDGSSFVMDASGKLVHELPGFEEALGFVDLENGMPQPGEIAAPLSLEASIYKALCVGVGDYVRKNGFPGVELGLSGGIDSALTLAIAVDALGAANVHAVMMPSQFTASMSLED